MKKLQSKNNRFTIRSIFPSAVIPQLLLLGFISYTLLLVALFLCTVELRSLHLYHCTYRLFGMSVILEYLGIIVQGMTWTRYGLTGQLYFQRPASFLNARHFSSTNFLSFFSQSPISCLFS